MTLWGHEGRVWRTEFLPVASSGRTSPTMGDDEAPSSSQLLLLSVGEDATCRLWSATPSAAGGGTGQVLKTWRDGHDGRSIWSLAVVPTGRGVLGGTAAEMRRYVLTGGADGAIRSWELPASPSGSEPSRSRDQQDGGVRATTTNGSGKAAGAKGNKVIAFRVAVAASDELDSDDSHFAVTLSADG